jgi:hypothetical protein
MRKKGWKVEKWAEKSTKDNNNDNKDIKKSGDKCDDIYIRLMMLFSCFLC